MQPARALLLSQHLPLSRSLKEISRINWESIISRYFEMWATTIRWLRVRQIKCGASPRDLTTSGTSFERPDVSSMDPPLDT
ncbi:hypothetical protein AAC387_Pa08g0753 [Persea americana]